MSSQTGGQTGSSMSTTMGGQMGNSTSATLRWMWRFGVSASVTLVVLGIGWQIASPSIVLRVSGHPGWWSTTCARSSSRTSSAFRSRSMDATEPAT